MKHRLRACTSFVTWPAGTPHSSTLGCPAHCSTALLGKKVLALATVGFREQILATALCPSQLSPLCWLPLDFGKHSERIRLNDWSNVLLFCPNTHTHACSQPSCRPAAVVACRYIALDCTILNAPMSPYNLPGSAFISLILLHNSPH